MFCGSSILALGPNTSTTMVVSFLQAGLGRSGHTNKLTLYAPKPLTKVCGGFHELLLKFCCIDGGSPKFHKTSPLPTLISGFGVCTKVNVLKPSLSKQTESRLKPKTVSGKERKGLGSKPITIFLGLLAVMATVYLKLSIQPVMSSIVKAGKNVPFLQ